MEPDPAAEIGLSARIADKNGRVIASRIFAGAEKFDKLEPSAAVAAFNEVFRRIAREMIVWTVQTI